MAERSNLFFLNRQKTSEGFEIILFATVRQGHAFGVNSAEMPFIPFPGLLIRPALPFLCLGGSGVKYRFLFSAELTSGIRCRDRIGQDLHRSAVKENMVCRLEKVFCPFRPHHMKADQSAVKQFHGLADQDRLFPFPLILRQVFHLLAVRIFLIGNILNRLSVLLPKAGIQGRIKGHHPVNGGSKPVRINGVIKGIQPVLIVCCSAKTPALKIDAQLGLQQGYCSHMLHPLTLQVLFIRHHKGDGRLVERQDKAVIDPACHGPEHHDPVAARIRVVPLRRHVFHRVERNTVVA